MNKSAAMRQMFEDGRSVAEAAAALGVRYQFAYNVHRQWSERRSVEPRAPSKPEARTPPASEDELTQPPEPHASTGPLDLHASMVALARKRPIFNSEADFQLALAWELKQTHPTATVRLEYRPVFLDRRGYLDLWVAGDGWAAAIELKYFTRALDLVIGEERFELLHQGALPINRRAFLRDVERVESVARLRPGVTGYAIALSNDAAYWRVPTVEPVTIDAAFRLHEGRTLGGSLAWSAAAGGTTTGREEPIELHARYPLHWRDYSRVAAGPAGTFRYLMATAT